MPQTANRPRIFEELSNRAVVAIVVGLGALFSSLLIYSGTTITFVPIGDTGTFMGTFAESMLLVATVAGGLLACAAFVGKRLPFRVLAFGGGALYLATAGAFVAFVWIGMDNESAIVQLATATAVADVCVALAWGRICARFKIREALVVTAGASVLSAVVLLACGALPTVPMMVVFIVAAVAAVAVPAALSRTMREKEPGARAVREMKGQVKSKLSALASVIAAPGAGLVVFAFVMAVMRGEFLDSQVSYLAMLALAGLVLAAYAALGKRPLSLSEGFYHTFLPLVALLLLAVMSISTTFALGETFTKCLTYALYSFALVITLATLCAIANAGEFSADLVFSAALFLFAVTSSAGQSLADLIGDDYVNVVVAVATALYAFVMVLSSYYTHRRDRLWMREDAEPPAAATSVPEASNAPSSPEVARDAAAHPAVQAPQAHKETPVPDPCEHLAAEYKLTPRETEILAYLAEGHSGAYISDALFISPNTVRTHIHNIYRKLGVSSREDILRMTRP